MEINKEDEILRRIERLERIIALISKHNDVCSNCEMALLPKKHPSFHAIAYIGPPSPRICPECKKPEFIQQEYIQQEYKQIFTKNENISNEDIEISFDLF